MAQGLSVNRVVNVNVNLSPQGASALNFDSLLVMGDSDVINVSDRIASYDSLEEVGVAFGTTAPEYLAAVLFFSQTPQPTQLYIGRWARTATSAILLCGPLTAAEQAIANWTAITTGGFVINSNGTGPDSITGLDFSAQTTLNGVASVINTALTTATAQATCIWNGSQFVFTSTTTGATSTLVALLAGPGGSVNIATLLKGTTPTLQQIVPGIAAETALAAVVIMDQLRTQWYGLMFASSAPLDDAGNLAVAGYIEGAGSPHVFGITTSEAAAVTTNDSTSIGYEMAQLEYNRTLCQYSTSSPYAMASFFGRAFTVNFQGNNTTITMMFKQEPGVVAENLNATQANALDSNNYNYFVEFNNNTAIIVNGKVASGLFFDEVWGVDWLANQVQTNIYNYQYTSPTKVPNTDPGNHNIATQIEAACAQGVTNGLLAPGIWGSAGFGQLQQGDFMSQGYYVYAPPVSTLTQADRAARDSVAFQVAAKLAGAVHQVNVTLNVNP